MTGIKGALNVRRTAAVVAILLLAATFAWVRPGLSPARASTHTMAAQQSSSLAHKLAQARTATAKYVTNLSRAKKDGYMIITQNMPGMGYHYLNPNISDFDVRKPAILVYEKTSNGMQLGALEWVFPSMPTKPTLPHATYTPADAESDCPTKSPSSGSAFNFWHPPLYTLHVWIWYPNPDGLYSSTNRLVNPFTSKM
jgi:hypothetical protein